MKATLSERNVDNILKVTKEVIQNSRNYHDYYIKQQDTFYTNQLHLLTSPNSLSHSIKEENSKDESYKHIRKVNIRSDNIPKLCPLYNDKGELLPHIATSSKINIRNLYAKFNLSEELANSPFIVSQRYINYGTIGDVFEKFIKEIFLLIIENKRTK